MSTDFDSVAVHIFLYLFRNLGILVNTGPQGKPYYSGSGMYVLNSALEPLISKEGGAYRRRCFIPYKSHLGEPTSLRLNMWATIQFSHTQITPFYASSVKTGFCWANSYMS